MKESVKNIDLGIFDILALVVVWAGVISLIVITNTAPGVVVAGLLIAYYLSKLIITKKPGLYDFRTRLEEI